MKANTVFKICRREDWQAARACGIYSGSADDRRDGFIHFSAASQMRATAAKHFAAAPDLVLLAVDVAALGAALKWEVSRGGALFPHLYAPLPVSAVTAIHDLPLGADGNHVFPDSPS